MAGEESSVLSLLGAVVNPLLPVGQSLSGFLRLALQVGGASVVTGCQHLSVFPQSPGS